MTKTLKLKPTVATTQTTLIGALPSLIGAVDRTLKDLAKQPVPVFLVVFAEGGAMFISNMDPEVAKQGVRDLVAGWETAHTVQ